MSSTWKKFAGKILRRCDLCGKFHAAYRLEDEQLGSLKLCYTCWSNREKKHNPKEPYMISRIWHGYTTPANADAYENLLEGEIFAWIAGRQIPGYRGIQLLRRELGEEVEFITIMWFDNLDAVHAFAGQDYEAAVVLPQAHALLAHYDARSQHFEVRVDQKTA